MFFFSRPALQSCLLSHVYSISECLAHCKQKPTNPKTFELQNENFKLGQELEESDTQLYECGTTVGWEGGGGTETEGTGFRGVIEYAYTVCLA